MKYVPPRAFLDVSARSCTRDRCHSCCRWCSPEMGYLFCVLWCGFVVQVYCHARGFMASFHAGFDHSRAARQVLHDFVDGKLLYCHAPPSQPTLTQFSFPADPEELAPGPEAVEGGVAAAPGTFCWRVCACSAPTYFPPNFASQICTARPSCRCERMYRRVSCWCWLPTGRSPQEDHQRDGHC